MCVNVCVYVCVCVCVHEHVHMCVWMYILNTQLFKNFFTFVVETLLVCICRGIYVNHVSLYVCIWMSLCVPCCVLGAAAGQHSH